MVSEQYLRRMFISAMETLSQVSSDDTAEPNVRMEAASRMLQAVYSMTHPSKNDCNGSCWQEEDESDED